MQSVFRSVSRGAALVAIVLFIAAPMLYADDFNPNQPPEARMQPPGGLTIQGRMQPPIGWTEPPPPLDARGQPPIGLAPEARIQPPGGWTELVRLVWQLAKIGPMR
jgi:hypothetical protein